MTQDLGTAYKRYKDNPEMKGLIYTVGNEQDYHFNVLFKILKKLGFKWSNHLFHLSYGMVDLPSGKMKSREGTVVDADELISEMVNNASKLSSDLGKLDGLSIDDKNALNHTIGLGARYVMETKRKRKNYLSSVSAESLRRVPMTRSSSIRDLLFWTLTTLTLTRPSGLLPRMISFIHAGLLRVETGSRRWSTSPTQRGTATTSEPS